MRQLRQFTIARPRASGSPPLAAKRALPITPGQPATCASRLVMTGVPVRRVQELMGRKSIAMTCRCQALQRERGAVLTLERLGAPRKCRNSRQPSPAVWEPHATAAVKSRHVAVH